jgi:glutamine synthetase
MSHDWISRLPDPARDFLSGRRLDEVECIVPDIAGVARGKAMPAAKFGKQTGSTCRTRSSCRRSPATGRMPMENSSPNRTCC